MHFSIGSGSERFVIHSAGWSFWRCDFFRPDTSAALATFFCLWAALAPVVYNFSNKLTSMKRRLDMGEWMLSEAFTHTNQDSGLYFTVCAKPMESIFSKCTWTLASRLHLKSCYPQSKVDYVEVNDYLVGCQCSMWEIMNRSEHDRHK